MSRISVWEQVLIDGVPIDALSQSEVVEHVFGSIDRGAGGVVITANADIMRRLRRPPGASLARDAALIVPDGMPLVWASRLMGTPLPERVNGTNLLRDLCGTAARRSRRVFLLGAAPGVAEEAGRVLATASAGLIISGVSSPPLGFDRDPVQWERVITEVVNSRPDLVFVALGYPRQEQVSLRLAEALPRTWFMGCGGALDLVAGRIQRAPVIFQRLGAEWLHRLFQEPRRLARRYFVDDAPYVLGMLMRAVLVRRRSRSA